MVAKNRCFSRFFILPKTLSYPFDELAMDDYDFSPNPVIKFFQQLLISAMYTGWIFFKLSIDFD
jgi:hypothetical protein